MTQAEIRKLVDEGRSIKEKMDALDTKLSGIKESLREEAKKQKASFFIGEKHFARISPDSSTSCDPKEYYELLNDLGRVEEFFGGVKVQITKAKETVGETVLADISTTKSVPYKKVSFLAKPPKKYLE